MRIIQLDLQQLKATRSPTILSHGITIPQPGKSVVLNDTVLNEAEI
jgi:hypothetical protein